MQIKYYTFGLRPIVEEIDNEGLSTYYAYQWKTGDFKEDMTYFRKITHDLSGEADEMAPHAFNAYVEELRNKLSY